MKRYFSYLVALVALCVVSQGPMATAQEAVSESELIAVLVSADSAKADKAITCKRLAVFGSAEAVPALAALLPDAELTSWARIALEAIPGPEASAALREAAAQTQGRTLVGIVNSIGVRQDTEAMPLLAKWLKSEDSDVAEAAAVALGRIGNLESAKILSDAFTEGTDAQRQVMSQGCVIAAETLLAKGENSTAIAMYGVVRNANVPATRKVEAVRGEILARGVDGLPLLFEQLQSPDRAMMNIGLAVARELPGTEVTKSLMAELEKMEPARRALLIFALADRGDAAALPALAAAVTDADPTVRVAAIEAMATIGDASCIAALLTATTDSEENVALAAKQTLTAMTDASVNAELVKRLQEAKGNTEMRRSLIELVGMRRIEASVPELRTAVLDAVSDATIRQAALTALGETVQLDDVTVLIEQVASPKYAEDAEIAQKALLTAAVRMPDLNACAAKLSAAMRGKSNDIQRNMLNILAAMGGSGALDTVGRVAQEGDRELQDLATQLLGNWMTVDAAPILWNIAKAPKHEFRIRALRGYLRIARQFIMTPEERLAICQNAMTIIERDAERKLVLEVAGRHPDLEMLKLVVSIGQSTPALKADVTATALAIAQKLDGSDEVLALLAKIGQKTVKIEILKAVYGAGDKTKDVTGMVQKCVHGFPLITLPKSTYNVAFGGDPASGVVKKLTIDYRMDGKTGQATFAENAAIVLPMPQ